MPKEAFVYIIDRFGARTGAAETCLKALKAAYKWGEDRGFPKDSPVHKITSPHKIRGGATPWEAADEEQFLKKHGTGTMARRWFLLARNMAGRIGDIPMIGPRHIVLADGRAFISWQPGKAGPKPVRVPVMIELAEELRAADFTAAAFLLTEYGRPFSSTGSLDNKIRKWIIEAGLTDADGKARLSQHGIRKYVAEELALAGNTVYEIMSRLSHSDPKTAAIYTAKVERALLAASGFERAEQARKRQGVPHPQKSGTLPTVNPIKIMLSEMAWQPVGESNPSFQVENLTS